MNFVHGFMEVINCEELGNLVAIIILMGLGILIAFTVSRYGAKLMDKP